MEKTRPIRYGVADCAQIRKKSAWFVDRAAKLRMSFYMIENVKPKGK